MGPSDIELNLLRKTELWIEGVHLENASLEEIARVIAEALELDKEEVLVVDVREEHLVLDILCSVVRASQIMGKASEILSRLAAIPGVFVSERTTIHSEGALGWVVLDPEESKRTIEKSALMIAEIRQKVAKRAIVFSTGTEVATGMITDTNFPLIEARLKERGYSVKYGGILPDEMTTIAYRLERAVDEGYGLIITTGGVGAEDKDCTVEALLRVDPQAQTPYILKFEVGTGRHVKDGVRIGMGKAGLSRLVALPGPTREVSIAIERLLEALDNGWDEGQTAEHIASGLRGRWKDHGHRSQTPTDRTG